MSGWIARAMGTLLALGMTPVSIRADDSASPPPLSAFAAHSRFDDLRISPDGKHIAFTHEEADNEVRLAIVTADLQTVRAQIGFGPDHHMGAHYWANNERVVAREWKSTGFLDSTRRFEQILSYDVDGRDRETLYEPGGPAFVRTLSRLRDDPDHILVSKQDYRDGFEVSLFRINVNTGKHDYLAGAPGISADNIVADVAVDTNDEVRFALELDQGKDPHSPDDDRTYLHYRTAEGQWKRLDVEQRRRPANYQPLGFSRDNQHFYFLSNHDMAAGDTLGLFSFDFNSTRIELQFRHPDVDIQRGVFGPRGEVLGVVYEPGYPQYHFIDPKDPHVQDLVSINASFPGQHASIDSYTEDGEIAIVFVYSDRNPGQYFLLKQRKLTHLADRFPGLQPERMGTQEAFTLHARDGVKLYGLLTLPPGSQGRNLPMVVHPHGGPHGPYDSWGYNAQVQMLATRGYAVLQVNFRGSGGYGTDFEQSGYRKWGREMQDDVTDATLWAINEGIADRNRICISGGSYGGYATLQGVVREPDLYRCAIGVAGVYSLPLFWKKGDYRTYGRASSNVFLDKYVGRDEAELKAYSPAYNVDRIKAELFIIHGSKDIRVPLDQAEFLREQLDAIGKPYEWLVRPEGHGFSQEANRVDQYRLMLEFLDRNIGAASLAEHQVSTN